MKDLQLIRCIYDYMGMSKNEIEDTEGFVAAKRAGENRVGCFLGRVREYNGHPVVKVDLEGDKVILEWVLQIQTENKQLKEENRWISVSERLPKNTDDVWMCSVKVKTLRKVGYGFYSKCNKEWIWFDRHGDKPTHWKPIILPEQVLKGK